MKKMMFKILELILYVILFPVVTIGMLTEMVGRTITATSHFFFLRPQEFVRDMKILWKDIRCFFRLEK